MIDLYHGDCLDVLPTLPSASVDAVIADTPYGTTQCSWDSVIPFEPMWKELKRLIKPRGAIVLFGSQPFTSALVMSNPEWFKYEWVWEKNEATGHLDANRRPMRAHEQVLVFAAGQTTYNPQKTTGHEPTRSGNTKYGITNSPIYRPNIIEIKYQGVTTRYPRSVQRFAKPHISEGLLHPTQKPLALLEYLVKTYTNEGDTVLDFTFGSCTTGVACVNLGRNFIGIEKDAGYFEIAERRITAAQAAMRQEAFA